MNLETRFHQAGVQLLAGKWHEAETAYREILQTQPDHYASQVNLANALRARQRWDEAEVFARNALQQKPEAPDAYLQLGRIFAERGRLKEARAALRKAVSLAPQSAVAHANLGDVLEQLGQSVEAEKSLRRAIARQPDLAPAYNNLGLTLLSQGRLNEAEITLREALKIQPAYVDALTNLGGVYLNRGQPNEAMAILREALQIQPHHATAHSNLIYALDYDVGSDTAHQQAERRAWAARHAAPHYPANLTFPNQRDPERRLRIGYVSGDFRQHAAAQAFGPVLFGHDAKNFELFAYADVAQPDAMTERFRAAVPHWLHVFGWSDAALAERVRADHIDILIDLGGHTAKNRLGVFARRPAPIEVTAFGQATGTGLATFSGLLADPVLIPSEERPLFAEPIYDLPAVFPYLPPAESPAPERVSLKNNAEFVLGCQTRLEKISAETITLWSQILTELPQAKLLLRARQLSNGEERARLEAAFIAHGISPERLELLPSDGYQSYLATYQRIDVSLNPFPVGGGLTTYDSLWMGVPVVTWRGQTPVSRLSASILSALHLSDWIAETPEDYRHLVIQLAGKADEIRGKRVALRTRLADSILVRGSAFTGEVEKIYRELWHTWCAAAPHQGGVTLIA